MINYEDKVIDGKECITIDVELRNKPITITIDDADKHLLENKEIVFKNYSIKLLDTITNEELSLSKAFDFGHSSHINGDKYDMRASNKLKIKKACGKQDIIFHEDNKGFDVLLNGNLVTTLDMKHLDFIKTVNVFLISINKVPHFTFKDDETKTRYNLKNHLYEHLNIKRNVFKNGDNKDLRECNINMELNVEEPSEYEGLSATQKYYRKNPERFNTYSRQTKEKLLVKRKEIKTSPYKYFVKLKELALEKISEEKYDETRANELIAKYDTKELRDRFIELFNIVSNTEFLMKAMTKICVKFIAFIYTEDSSYLNNVSFYKPKELTVDEMFDTLTKYINKHNSVESFIARRIASIRQKKATVVAEYEVLSEIVDTFKVALRKYIPENETLKSIISQIQNNVVEKISFDEKIKINKYIDCILLYSISKDDRIFDAVGFVPTKTEEDEIYTEYFNYVYTIVIKKGN